MGDTIQNSNLGPDDSNEDYFTDSTSSSMDDENPVKTQGLDYTTEVDYDVEQHKAKTNEFLSGSLSLQDYTASIELKDDETPNLLNIASTSREKGARKTGRHLPTVLKGLMGEANLLFARGNTDLALKMCLEVIREHPTAPEPFLTLAQIYEDKGMPEKSFQFALIAAHLNPRDGEQWIHLSQLAEQQGDSLQAISCLAKAIRCYPNDIQLHLKRANIIEQKGDKRGLVKAYHKLVEVVTPELGTEILKYAKLAATYYHEDGDINKAREVMEIAFKKVPTFVTIEEVNLLLELLMHLKEYFKALEIISTHCDVKVEAEEDIMEDGNTNEVSSSGIRVITCEIPENIAIELRVKLTVILIHMHTFHLIPDLLTPFTAVDVELYGDLFIDVVEALMSENQYPYALKLLKILVDSKNFSLAAVWLKYAECLKTVSKIEESISAYLMVMRLAPKHVEARLMASEILNQLGRSDEAISVLTQDPSMEILDAGLLYERCQLLKGNKERIDEYLAVGRLLLSRHCAKIQNRAEITLLTKFKSINSKLESIRKMQESNITAGVPDLIETKTLPADADEFGIFLSLCDTVFETKQFALLQRLTFSALGSAKLNSSVESAFQLFYLAVVSCYYNKDSFYGYNLMRNLIIHEINNPKALNLFNLLLNDTDPRNTKFLARQLARRPQHRALSILQANSYHLAGTYRHALSEYMKMFRQAPNAFLALMISISMLQISCQKTCDKRNSMMTQCIAFLWEYKKLRGEECAQEAHYNIARAYHQLGLLPAAVYHYKKALEIETPLLSTYKDLLDLKREAAFNLSLIYRNSGSMSLARSYIEKYIII